MYIYAVGAAAGNVRRDGCEPPVLVRGVQLDQAGVIRQGL